ncbi:MULTISPECIES: AI-2E family transporter [Eubacteriales]|uniref:AI-2E family transporter n=1 Tax=Bittarella massiliensis (ex Durand et al. 2017) TaxID=1720313 RepID=A0AAQ1MD86_9FIRM|nr:MULTISPECIES: AI-2E family transporter [Eubacteriales]ERI96128.1 putative sporulation integral membrane protein YtvI [Clostridium sp. ATCC 29733]MZL68811.1 AI-2E family transporter [Bittarella massiliensis (ex Durand et al. 2017)]MZL80169.1 AI-2E family transporter [Bittarella massiliensis (ex Durand et al. 2017)]SHG06848.1 sporulation integral membrane protein YtvI [Bittarella massiliensis (ex Durand et al. 2017)]
MEKRRAFLENTLFFGLVLALGLLGVHWLLPLLSPLLAGFFVAFVAARPARWLHRRWRLPQRGCQTALTALLYLGLGAAIWYFGARLVVSLGSIFSSLPGFYAQEIAPLLSRFQEWLLGFIEGFSPGAPVYWEDFFALAGGSIDACLQKLSAWAMGAVTRLAAALPAVFLWCSVAVISGLFFAADYRGITRFFARCTPPRLAQVLYLVKDCVQRSALQMAKSYLILMAVTFAELAAGFWLLGIAHPVSMALLVAFVDLLPILGTGAVLVPWAAFLLLSGNTGLGLQMALLYAVISMVRSLLEPKVLGNQVGLHPLVALSSAYLGGAVLGFWGIFLGPLGAIVAQDLIAHGVIRLPGRVREARRRGRADREGRGEKPAKGG